MYEDQQRTRPYGAPPTSRVFLHNIKHAQGSGWLTIIAGAAAALSVALAAWTTVQFQSYKSAATAQISQLRHDLAKTQSTVAKMQSGSARSLNGLSDRVSAMSATVSGVSQFNKVCSQALTAASGPAEFYFPCSQQPPGH